MPSCHDTKEKNIILTLCIIAYLRRLYPHNFDRIIIISIVINKLWHKNSDNEWCSNRYYVIFKLKLSHIHCHYIIHLQKGHQDKIHFAVHSQILFFISSMADTNDLDDTQLVYIRRKYSISNLQTIKQKLFLH